MKVFRTLLLTITSIAALAMLFGVGGDATVLAQGTDTYGIQAVDQNIVLGNQDIRVTVARIIRGFLGFLGIIAVLVVLYGGFVFMTAGGNEENVSKGKKILVNGVIGLLIIFSSFAIVQFVLSRLSEATGIDQGTTQGGGAVSGTCADTAYAAANPGSCFGGTTFCSSFTGYCDAQEHFIVKSITPSTPAQQTLNINNVVTRVLFSKPLANSVDLSEAVILESQGGNRIPVQVDVLPGRVGLEIIAQQTTPACDQILPADETCLLTGQYKISVNPDLVDREGNTLETSVGAATYPLSAEFEIGAEIIDNEAPQISSLLINGSTGVDMPLTAGTAHTLQLIAEDNNGIGYVEIALKNRTGSTINQSFEGPHVLDGSVGDFNLTYPLILGSNLSVQTQYTLTITTYDLDHNSSVTSTTFVVVAEHCANGIQDADETDIDVGGSCALQNGAYCSADWECASQACVNNICVAWPMITNVDPWDGSAGNWITVSGQNFGDTPGTLEFGYTDTQTGQIVWVPAQMAQCGAVSSWQDSYVIAVVPEDTLLPAASESVIRITRADNATYQDTTRDARGPIGGPNNGYFTKNTDVRPGLCAVTTPSGAHEAFANEPVIAKGTQLGTTQGQSIITFGGVQGSVDQWTDVQVDTSVPQNMARGRVGVAVTVDGKQSNGIPFTVLDQSQTSAGPVIVNIAPREVTPGSYLTVTGQNFGAQVGLVYLAPSASATCADPIAEGCIQLQAVLPAVCGDTWNANQVIVAVPNNTQIGNYSLLLRNNSGLQGVSSDSVAVIAGDPLPSICSISPQSGPAPLPATHPGIAVHGINFSNTPSLYFWTVGAQETNINSWLHTAASDITVVDTNTYIATRLPISALGNSVQTGPVVLQSQNGALSNPVRYEVNDCRVSGTIPGYQCCTDGPDAGLLKSNDYICAGETRDAGYVWRFTTGKIPNIPYVIESCNTENWDSPNAIIDFPSPTPWENYTAGTQACVNANIAVQFSMAMRPESLNDNVRLYTCGSASQPDCTNAQEITDITLLLQNDVLRIIPDNPTLDANTWYHIELDRDIQSQETVTVLGDTNIVYENLLSTRSCGDGTAYCYDFRTGNGMCSLVAAHIMPQSFTTRVLGTVLDPRFPAAQSKPLYYYLFGRANQECTTMSVDGLGWNWNTNNPSIARTFVAPLAPQTSSTATGYTDSRATAEAYVHTAPDAAIISAATSGVALFPTSSLTIDLEDPRVDAYWPNCAEACVNSGIGVRFNRHMNIDDFASGIKLWECADETCTTRTQNMPVSVQSAQQTFFQLQAYPTQNMKADTWYIVEVLPSIRSIGKFRSGTDIPEYLGTAIDLFTWKFRTKADGSLCAANRVALRPDSIVTHLIGEKTKFQSIPFSSPDECSPSGQELNPWNFGWVWNSDDTNVAEITKFESFGDTPAYCTLSCLPAGSDVIRTALNVPALCGNGIVESGEDCDIGNQNEILGTSCTLNCLRPGSASPICGNGRVEVSEGEECDINDPLTGAYCAQNCLYTGSPRDPNLTDPSAPWCGSRSVTVGENCDVNDPNTNVGCSNSCLNMGTQISQTWCTQHASNPYNGTIIAFTPECSNAVSVCGNGIVESGEECEINAQNQIVLGGIAGSIAVTGNPENYCNAACLLQNICDVTQIPLAVPGSNTVGYRCDSNEEGCAIDCTLAGSSPLYDEPSQCGDAVYGVGESSACEVVAQNQGSSLGQSPVQFGTAIGRGVVDPQTKMQQTQLHAEISNQYDENGNIIAPAGQISGDADYALQCGYIEYEQPVSGRYNNCPNATDGVASNSCCYARPVREAEYPVDGAGLDPSSPNVCRNTYISVTFDRKIDEGTLNNNLVVATRYPAGFVCASEGLADITGNIQAELAYLDNTSSAPTTWWARLWNSVKYFFVRVFGGDTARASTWRLNDVGVWCSGNVAVSPDVTHSSYEDNATTTVSLYINKLLDADTTYAVLLTGGQNGIKSIDGVGIGDPDNPAGSVNDIWLFKTGSDVCKVQSASVEPSSHVFVVPDTTQSLAAKIVSSNGQQIVSIPGVYNWTYAWGPLNNQVVTIPTSTSPSVLSRATSVQGEVNAILSLTVTEDIDQTNNQIGRTYTGVSHLVSLFCATPWPDRNYYPYREGVRFGETRNMSGYDFRRALWSGKAIDSVIIGTNSEYFNFSMGYCADAGSVTDTSDDLPYLKPLVFTNRFDFDASGTILPREVEGFSDDTLKKFLFFNDKNDDVIGIQIFTNPNRFSAREWYVNRFGNTSNLQSTSVAGYDAVVSGNNIYINALNQSSNGSIYNNIYLFSINNGAQQQTQDVFAQLMESVVFNINISDFGYCSYGGDMNIPNMDSAVSCTTDFDCLGVSRSEGICANAKTKFLRDWERLVDVQAAQEKLETYANKEGSYPKFEGGSYIPQYTVSRWPSWSTLSNAIGGLPTDPVNEWSSCGICSNSKSFCTTNTDCRGTNDVCTIADSQTCWAQEEQRYLCPQVASVYEYELNSATNNYVIHAPLEYLSSQSNVVQEFVDLNKFSEDRWCQAGANISPFGSVCGDGVVSVLEGEQCDPVGSTKVVTMSPLGTRCNSGEYMVATCNAQCQYEYGSCIANAQCGNGVVDSGEICDDGALNDTYGHCSSQSQCTKPFGQYCGNGVLDRNANGTPLEYCDQAVNGACIYMNSNGVAETAQAYIMLDRSSSMSANGRWDQAKIAVRNITGRLAGSVKMGLAVFKGTGTNACTATELVALNNYPSDTPVFLNALNNLNPDGLTPTGDAIRYVFDNRDTIYEPASAAPRMVILITDGEPNATCPITGPGDIANTETEIRNLYAQGILTYIVGFGEGINPETLNRLAQAGGTNNLGSEDRFYLANNTTQIEAAIADILSCSSYNLYEGASCSYDCQSPGGFCGDGIVQSQYEQCDDSNKNSGDGCSTFCTVETTGQNVSVAPTTAGCGNGVVDTGEACDLGTQNGVACTPGYGNSCTYCSLNCSAVLTVDPNSYCGNGVVDSISGSDVYEMCDVLSNGQVVTRAIDPDTGSYSNTYRAQCDDVGTLSCANQCSTISQNCQICIAYNDATRTIPQAAFINPMLGNYINTLWGVEEYVALYRPSQYTNTENPSLSILQQLNNQVFGSTKLTRQGGTAYPANYKDPTQYNNLLAANRSIEGDSLCTEKYYLYFNAHGHHHALTGSASGFSEQNLRQQAYSGVYGDAFAYPVNGSKIMRNDYVVSPAVPEGMYRIVIKWDKADLPTENSFFYGGVYNDAFTQTQLYRTNKYDYFDAMSNTVELCNDMSLTSNFRRVNYRETGLDPFGQYWLPVHKYSSGSQTYCGYAASVFMHPPGRTPQLGIQSITIDTNDVALSDFRNGSAAFFVQLSGPLGISPIYNYRNSSLVVEVYEYHQGQIPQLSVYKPTKVFRIAGAAQTSSNPQARYWHVFNIVNINGKMQIEPFKPSGNPESPIIRGEGNGAIETDWSEVLLNYEFLP